MDTVINKNEVIIAWSAIPLLQYRQLQGHLRQYCHKLMMWIKNDTKALMHWEMMFPVLSRMSMHIYTEMCAPEFCPVYVQA